MPRRRPQIGRPLSAERIGRLTNHVPRGGLCTFPAPLLSAKRSNRTTSCRTCPDCSPAWRPVLLRNAVEPESRQSTTSRTKGNLRPLYCRRAGAPRTPNTTYPAHAGKTRRSARADRAEAVRLKHPSDFECEARGAIHKQRCAGRSERAATRSADTFRSRRAHGTTNRIGRRIHPPSRAGVSRAVAPHEGRRDGRPAHPCQ